MKKRAFAIAMTGVLVASLAGCGGGNAQTEAPAQTSGKAAEAGSSTTGTTGTGSGDKTVINIWSKDRHDADYVQAKVDEYNKTNNDNIEVKYQLYTDNYVQAVDMAVQNNELPDILVYQETIFNKYVGTGQWADLYPFMDSDMKSYFADEVFDGYNEFDGKLYYIPTTGTTCRLFYNKEIFERVGITNPPETLEEMVQDAKLITSELSGEGIYGFAENMKSANSSLMRSLVVGLEREQGTVQGYDFAKGAYDFTSWSDYLSLWKELLSDECAFPGCESLDIDPLRTQFAAGHIGMYMSYSHAEPGVYANQFPMDSSKWDCAPIPTVGGKVTGKQYFSGTSAYLLNAKGKNLDKAFKVYKDIFTTEDFLTGYYEGGYGVSIVPSILEKANPSEDFKTKKWLLINRDTDALLPKPPHESFSGGLAVEGEDLFKTCESIYYGGADITSTLQDLTDRYNKAYKDAIASGMGTEIRIEGYDPMNPKLK